MLYQKQYLFYIKLHGTSYIHVFTYDLKQNAYSAYKIKEEKIPTYAMVSWEMC